MEQNIETLGVDEIIGANLRRFRQQRGLSGTALGEAVGITYQQLHKYENAENRVAASRLLAFARVLEVPVELFFEGIDGIGAEHDPHLLALVQRTAGALIAIPEPIRSHLVGIIQAAHRTSAALVAPVEAALETAEGAAL